MGLSWQQGPLAPGAIGRFLVPQPPPEQPLYLEPLRRRMRVRFGGVWIADSENVLLFFEPGRYPVAYFPQADVSPEVLERSEHTTKHPDLGQTSWYLADLDEAKLQAKSAALDAKYTKDIQTQYETYYEKVLSTQTTWLSILAAAIAIVSISAGVFSFRVFDSRMETTLAATVAQLEQRFSEKMQWELETLRKQNTELVERRVEDVEARMRFNLQFSQGLSFSWRSFRREPRITSARR